MTENSVFFFNFIYIEFLTYGRNHLFFWWIKPEKWIKLIKNANFSQARKISFQIDDEYYKNEKTLKSENFMTIFA